MFGFTKENLKECCWVGALSCQNSFFLGLLKNFPVSSQPNSVATGSFKSQAGKLARNVKAEFRLITSAASDSGS